MYGVYDCFDFIEAFETRKEAEEFIERQGYYRLAPDQTPIPFPDGTKGYKLVRFLNDTDWDHEVLGLF